MPDKDADTSKVEDGKTGDAADDAKAGNSDPEDGKGASDDSEKKFTQADMDRAVENRLKRADTLAKERESVVAAKAKKQAEEARLLEDGKIQDYADLKAKEAEEARSKLDDYERKDTVRQLLDKKKILLPEEREHFERMKFDGLEELDKLVDGYNAMVDARVQKGVEERVGTDSPAKAARAAAERDFGNMDPKAWAEYKKAHDISGGTPTE